MLKEEAVFKTESIQTQLAAYLSKQEQHYNFSFILHDDKEAKELIHLLAALNPNEIKLFSLTLKGDGAKLSHESWLALDKQLHSVLEAQQKTLQEITLIYLNWPESTMEQWLNALPKCTELKKLLLNDNQLRAAFGKALGEVLPHCKKLQTLILGGNQLDAKALEIVLKGLNHKHPLTTLSLSGNPLGKEGLSALVNWLTPNSQHKPPKQFENLFLSHCGIKEVESLFASLESAKLKLKILTLNQNALSSHQALFMVKGIKQQTALTRIDFTENPWTIEGLMTFQASWHEQPAVLLSKNLKPLWNAVLENAEAQKDSSEMMIACHALLQIDARDEGALEKLTLAQSDVVEQAEQLRTPWQAHYMDMLKKSTTTIQMRRYKGESDALKVLKAFYLSEFRFLQVVETIRRKLFALPPAMSLDLYAPLKLMLEVRWPFTLTEELNGEHFANLIQQLLQDVQSKTFITNYAHLSAFSTHYFSQSVRSEFTQAKKRIAAYPADTTELADIETLEKQLFVQPYWLLEALKRISSYESLLTELLKAFITDPVGKKESYTPTQKAIESMLALLSDYAKEVKQSHNNLASTIAALSQKAQLIQPDQKPRPTSLMKVLEPNMAYEYESEDIDAILKTLIEQKGKADAIEVLGALDSFHSETQMAQRFTKIKQEYPNKLVLLPYNKGGQHWLGLLIQLDNGKVKRAIGFDPLGVKLDSAMTIHQAFNHAFHHAIEWVDFLIQPDMTSCGVVVTDGLITLAYSVLNQELKLTKIKLDTHMIQSMRLHHLIMLEQFRPQFFKTFYPRQKDNKHSFTYAEQFFNLFSIKSFQFTEVQQKELQNILNHLEQLSDRALIPQLNQIFHYETKFDDAHEQYLTQIRAGLNEMRGNKMDKADREHLNVLLTWLFQKSDDVLAPPTFKQDFELIQMLGKLLSLIQPSKNNPAPQWEKMNFKNRTQTLMDLAQVREKNIEGLTSLKLVAKDRTFILLGNNISSEESKILDGLIYLPHKPPGEMGKGEFGRIEVAQCILHKENKVIYTAAKKIIDTKKKELSDKEDTIHHALKDAPNIIPFYGSMEHADILYQFTGLGGLGNGEDFQVLLRSLKETKSLHFTEELNIWTYVTYCLLQAIHYLHQHSYVHLDITASNFVMTVLGEVFLIDFGRSYQLKPNESTETQEYHMANRLFFSPQRLFNLWKKDIQPQPIYDLKKADIWALGMAIYVLMTGHGLAYEISGIVPSLQQWETKEFEECLMDIQALQKPTPDSLWEVLKLMLAIEDKDRATTETLLKHPAFKNHALIQNPAEREKLFAELIKRDKLNREKGFDTPLPEVSTLPQGFFMHKGHVYFQLEGDDNNPKSVLRKYA